MRRGNINNLFLLLVFTDRKYMLICKFTEEKEIIKLPFTGFYSSNYAKNKIKKISDNYHPHITNIVIVQFIMKEEYSDRPKY